MADIATYLLQTGQRPPSSDTGDYCRARAKLSLSALRRLVVESARQLERDADAFWLWKGLHAKLVDGFTFTMPDTPESQEAFPQLHSQSPGVGFPIARACTVMSLATACVCDMAIGPYQGKQTGENALFREMLDAFDEGDVIVFDRCYCSFMMLAMLSLGGVHVCARLHQLRPIDFRRGRRLGKGDHLHVDASGQAGVDVRRGIRTDARHAHAARVAFRRTRPRSSDRNDHRDHHADGCGGVHQGRPRRWCKTVTKMARSTGNSYVRPIRNCSRTSLTRRSRYCRSNTKGGPILIVSTGGRAARLWASTTATFWANRLQEDEEGVDVPFLLKLLDHAELGDDALAHASVEAFFLDYLEILVATGPLGSDKHALAPISTTNRSPGT